MSVALWRTDFFGGKLVKRLGLAGCLCALLAGPGVAAQYFCTPSQATGFYYDAEGKDWKSTRFTTNMYYIISPTQFGKHAYVVKRLGDPDATAYCNGGFTGSGLLLCARRHISFKFSKATGLYVIMSTGDYLASGSSPGADTIGPWVQIGRCSDY